MNSIKTGAQKVGSFIKSGFKKSMSLSYDSDTYVIKRIKTRSYDLYSNFRDFFYVIYSFILIIVNFLIIVWQTFKNIPNAFQKAAQNNFRIGIEMLQKNNIADAKVRFLLSNMFYSKSATTKYYIAYVYYVQGNYTKSLEYIQQAININPSHKKSLKLIEMIETALDKKI